METSPLTTPPTAQQQRSWAGPTVTILIDVVLIMLFAGLGRRSHEVSLDIVGIFQTALPFIAALVIASIVTVFWRTWARVWPAGVFVWAITVAGGLALRVLVFGDTAAFSFQIVAALVLALLLLGRRLASSLIIRRRAPASRS